MDKQLTSYPWMLSAETGFFQSQIKSKRRFKLVHIERETAGEI